MTQILVTSSVLILALLLLRSVIRGRIGMRLQYALWLAAALRLMLPVSLGSSTLSVMNLWPERRGGEGYAQSADRQLGVDPEAGRYPIDVVDTDKVERFSVNSGADDAIGFRHAGTDHNVNAAGSILRANPSRTLWALRLLWVLGAAVIGGYMAASQIRFVHLLMKKRTTVSAELIPPPFADRLERHRMKVYRVDGLTSPCLVGRNIYIDSQLLGERERLPHILAHEYCHARHCDGLWAFLRCALAAVYWFDPLVWAAACAARQDSELACDEAVIRMLGEEERFAYGRTLLYLLSGGSGRIDCAGTALTMEGRRRSVKERVSFIAGRNGTNRWAAAAVLAAVCLVCGCAFTGADGDHADDSLATESRQAAQDEEGTKEEENGTESDMQESGKSPASEGTQSGEAAGGQSEDEETWDEEKDAKEEAFLAALHYQGVMEGRDDSGHDRESAGLPEDGWNLLCRDPKAQIAFYGLYTERFGCRGVKTLIGEEVNTYDIAWCPSAMNEDGANVRVLEEAEDGRPRRFLWKCLSENTSVSEVWRLYSGQRYDTGTVELQELTKEAYSGWISQNLTFRVVKARDEVEILWDGNRLPGAVDISDCRGLQIESVEVNYDLVGFALDGGVYGTKVYEGYDGPIQYLTIGLKLEGRDEIRCAGRHPLAVQVLCDDSCDGGFRLQQPKIDEQSVVLHPLIQERKPETGRDQG